jgi:hypothetical protein
VTPRRRWLTSAFLLFFAGWDLALGTVAIVFPDFWWKMMYGVARVDPQALMARTGGLWLAFAVFHLVAFFKWKTRPYWLVLVGGMRLAEIPADPLHALLAQHTTLNGKLTLMVGAPISNLCFALFFIHGALMIWGPRPLPAPAAAPAGTAGAARP